MANVLTPIEIWHDFKIKEEIEYEIIDEKTVGDILISRIYLNGKQTEDGRVKIFGVLARNVQISICPAILISQGLSRPTDENYVIEMAKQGYLALTIDLTGNQEGYHTEYPKSLSFATYDKDRMHNIENAVDIKNTCWYEWGVVVKYAFAFLKKMPYVTKIGAIGIRGGAFPIWMLSATEKELACSVFLFNAGWSAYKNNFKFSKSEEPELTDWMLGYLAGVEPQSYAPHVKCPALILCSTNSKKYDADRAYDTRAIMKGFSLIDYSPNRTGSLNAEAYTDLKLFLDGFLIRGDGAKLKEDLEIKVSLDNKTIKIETVADEEGLAGISLYASESEINPALRCWKKTDEKSIKEIKEGKAVFKYNPYPNSKIAFFFAKAKYKNGMSVSSAIVSKEFSEADVMPKRKSNVIYSGDDNQETIFTVRPKSFSLLHYIDVDKLAEVQVKKGPMDIYGVFSPDRLFTYIVNSAESKPNENAILMMDVYSKIDTEMEVTLYTDYIGERVPYTAKVSIKGGQVWYNIMIEKKQFKTQDGKSLQSYSSVQALEISMDGEYLINNVLWI